jgi:hypothetical protein
MNNSTKMSAEISKLSSRFSIKMTYDAEVVEYIKSINGRFWNDADKSWTMPNEAYEATLDRLKAKKFEISVIDKNVDCVIKDSGEQLTLKFYTHVDFKVFKILNNYSYNKELGAIQLPCDDLASVQELLSEIGLTFDVQKVDPNEEQNIKNLVKQFASINVSGENLRLNFNTHYDFSKLKELDGYVYDKEQKEVILPTTQLPILEDLLKSDKIKFFVKVQANSPKPNTKTSKKGRK